MTTVLACFIILQLFLFGNKQISRLCKNVMAKISNPPRHIKATTQHKTSLNMFSLKSGYQASKKYTLATKWPNIVLVNGKPKAFWVKEQPKLFFERAYNVFWLL